MVGPVLLILGIAFVIIYLVFFVAKCRAKLISQEKQCFKDENEVETGTNDTEILINSDRPMLRARRIKQCRLSITSFLGSTVNLRQSDVMLNSRRLV